MFNYGGSSKRFNNRKVLGGVMAGDYQTHRTLFAGPDPADANRVLIRKLVQTSENVWAFEESRITAAANEGELPSVHTTLHRLGGVNLAEHVSEEELAIRLQYRSIPNVVGFSLFTRPWAGKSGSSWSLVENTHTTQARYRWTTWW